MASAKFGSNQFDKNFNESKTNFRQIWIVMKESIVRPTEGQEGGVTLVTNLKDIIIIHCNKLLGECICLFHDMGRLQAYTLLMLLYKYTCWS